MEKKLKHLEFLQLVITRMNVNSFLLKGWTVSLVAALFAFAAKDANIKYVLITYISTPLFWSLDGYYLSIERQYRELYNVVKDKNEDAIDFDLNATPYNKGKNMWIPCIFSKTLFIFYGTLIFVTLVVMFFIN
jgi:4-amino-4-deoxy-L-arabinose transferase-like glycosyltransferase